MKIYRFLIIFFCIIPATMDACTAATYMVSSKNLAQTTPANTTINPSFNLKSPISTSSAHSFWRHYIIPFGIGLGICGLLYTLLPKRTTKPKTFTKTSPPPNTSKASTLLEKVKKLIPATSACSIIGLHNNGNTCYRNALLQTLRPALKEFATIATTENQSTLQKKWHGFIEEFTKQKNEYSPISLAKTYPNLHNFLADYFPKATSRQQDSHELFMRLCDDTLPLSLKQEDSRDWQTIVAAVNTENKNPDLIQAKEKFDRRYPLSKLPSKEYTDLHNHISSFMNQQFSVSLTSTISPLSKQQDQTDIPLNEKKRAISVTLDQNAKDQNSEKPISLTLQPSDVYSTKKEQQKNITLSFPQDENKEVSLEDLFLHTFASEELTGENKYKYEHGEIEEYVDATKQTTITPNSKYLMIQLNRLADPAKPITKKVSIPTTFTLPASIVTNPKDQKKYALKGIVMRSQTSSSGGHYWAWVLDEANTTWVQRNDSSVTVLGKKDSITSDNAYLLLYKEI